MLTLQGGQTVSGTISVSGSKNAALPLIGAALLFKKTTLKNVPMIGDVFTFLEIIKSLGVAVDFKDNVLTMDTSNMDASQMNMDLVKKIRASILLMPSMLARFGKVDVPFPGGCNIGKRPVDEHLSGLGGMGYATIETPTGITVSGKARTGDITVSASFAVTATENIISAAVVREGVTTIQMAAIEPHVMCLVNFFRSQGIQIDVWYDHSIVVHGGKELPENAEWTVIADYIESGTFIVLGALASKEYLDIQNARIGDLFSFLSKCKEIGVRFEDLGNDTLRVYRSIDNLKALKKLQTNIFPGFPTDLQSPFVILLTQAEGISRVEEIMFEGRLNYLVEIEKMKGHPAILNPNTALIFGKTKLRGATVSSWDLRAGVAMILAGLVAEGETRITNVEYIERGYEDILGKLRKIGVVIEKVETIS